MELLWFWLFGFGVDGKANPQHYIPEEWLHYPDSLPHHNTAFAAAHTLYQPASLVQHTPLYPETAHKRVHMWLRYHTTSFIIVPIESPLEAKWRTVSLRKINSWWLTWIYTFTFRGFCWWFYPKRLTTIHSHNDGGDNHEVRQPACREESGWGILLRDPSTPSYIYIYMYIYIWAEKCMKQRG